MDPELRMQITSTGDFMQQDFLNAEPPKPPAPGAGLGLSRPKRMAPEKDELMRIQSNLYKALQQIRELEHNGDLKNGENLERFALQAYKTCRKYIETWVVRPRQVGVQPPEV